MTTFLQGLRRATNGTRTENGDRAHKSSLDPLVDFFGLAGAMRDRPEAAADLFDKAYHSNPLLAVRALFYLRDVRGGQGERAVFRAGLKRLRVMDPDAYRQVVCHVPVYGRWDDLWADGLSAIAADMIATQWIADVAAYQRDEPVSLLAKWMPSDKAANKAWAIQMRESLGLTQREYRHTLSALRARIGLLEQHMSAKDWGSVDYSKLPSQAHRKHVKAFRRNDGDRYAGYLDAVDRGEAKINAGTLYPYQLYDMTLTAYGTPGPDPKAAEAFWKNLPDYTRPGQDALVLADVSGSMQGQPISVSVSLAVYFAERNTGPYAGHFMSFASTPELVKIPTYHTLCGKFQAVRQSTGWWGSTNLEAAFKAILNAGVSSGVVPGVLYIVSDMQFDQALNHADLSVFEAAENAFLSAGLTLPHVVFWNVNARHDQLPATIMDERVTLVSGLSPTVFSMAVEGKSPRELVEDVLCGERYSPIVL